MSDLNNLPLECIWSILILTPYEDLYYLFYTSKLMYDNFHHNELFWKDKIRYDFGINSTNTYNELNYLQLLINKITTITDMIKKGNMGSVLYILNKFKIKEDDDIIYLDSPDDVSRPGCKNIVIKENKSDGKIEIEEANYIKIINEILTNNYQDKLDTYLKKNKDNEGIINIISTQTIKKEKWDFLLTLQATIKLTNINTLLIEVANNSKWDSVFKLIELGANPSYVMGSAMRQNLDDIVYKLIEKKANLESALGHAMENNKWHIVNDLIDKGVKYNYPDVMYYAAKQGNWN